MRHILSTALVVILVASGCGDDGQTSPTTTTVDDTTSTAEDTTTTAAPSTTTTTTSTTTPTTTTTSEPESVVVQVFFLDEDAFNVGTLPYVQPVERTVTPEAPEAAALDELFAGPTSDEETGGLRFVASEATGIADFSIVDGTARVQLAGGCSSGGSTFTVANHIVPTLLQFTSIDAVKIYDPEGGTEAPDEPGDSIPFCLEP